MAGLASDLPGIPVLSGRYCPVTGRTQYPHLADVLADNLDWLAHAGRSGAHVMGFNRNPRGSVKLLEFSTEISTISLDTLLTNGYHA